MINAEDIQTARILIRTGYEIVTMAVEWLQTGKRPPAKRVEEVWASVEQLKAKLLTDAAADARWPREDAEEE